MNDSTWRRLIETVFAPSPDEHRLALLVDLPDDVRSDHPAWLDRRQLASEWLDALRSALRPGGIHVELWLYPNAHTNNGDLPDRVWPWSHGALPAHARELAESEGLPFSRLFETLPMAIALTEFSATAPMKIAARRYGHVSGFRAATMPGFTRAMMPALAVDISEVDHRCQVLKRALDQATGADIVFTAEGTEYRLYLDLRHRTSHASSGLIRTPGTAGNLPSGETYIVPYEGELSDDPSRSAGELPVELEGEIVIYDIVANKAVDARTASVSSAVVGTASRGPVATREAELLRREPAYANLAELGLGVLAAFGVEPVGRVLLDEKLAPHIAFGRSEHFGGSVGPQDFSSPDAVVHVDRVYADLPNARVRVAKLDLVSDDVAVSSTPVIRDGAYVIDFRK